MSGSQPSGFQERLRTLAARAPKPVRIAIGALLVVGGVLGFMPVLGFWMIPLGLLLLSYDVPVAARLWRLVASALTRAHAALARWPPWRILIETIDGWNEDRGPTMAAAIAFYTVFSLPATLLLVVWIVGLVLGNEAAQTALLSEAGTLMGPQAATTLRNVLEAAAPSASNTYAAIFAGVTLVIGATTVFAEIHNSLNVIWRMDERSGGGIWSLVKGRLLGISVILAIGFLLLVSLAISAVASAMLEYFAALHRDAAYAVEAINMAISFATTFLLFGLMYKLLPTVRTRWRQVWHAALATSVLFTVGKYLIAIYIGRSNVASIFGAGSVVIAIILWVYYSVSIFLLGAEFAKAYAKVVGSRAAGPQAATTPSPRPRRTG